MIVGVVVLHIWALHVPGNNNPAGVADQVRQGHAAVPSVLTMKDIFALVVFLMFFS